MYFKRAIIWVCCVFSSLVSLSQLSVSHLDKANSILDRVRQNYLSLQAFEAKLELQYFTDHTTNQAKESQEMTIKKFNSSFYKSIMGLKEFRNEEFYLSLYSERELITLDKSVHRPLDELLGVNFAFTQENVDSVSIQSKPSESLIRIWPLEGEILMMDFYIDTDLWRLKKQTVYYKSNFLNEVYGLTSSPRITTQLIRFEDSIMHDLKDFFESDDFLLSANKNAIQSQGFKNYTVVNLID